MAKWAEKWKMVFNVSKCVHLEMGSLTPTHNFCLNGQIIPQGTSVKYLGDEIDSQLKFKEHIDNIVEKGNNIVANEKPKLLAFNTIVQPCITSLVPTG